MRDLDWNFVRSFLAVAEKGSLLRAAASLGMTQPAIGRHITALEDTLGVRLFTRSRSGMALTESGLAMLEDAQALRGDLDRFLLKASGFDERVSGTVRITASRVVSVYILPAMIARLKLEEPDIEIELVPDNAIANLLSRDADIALRMVRPVQNDVIAAKAGTIAVGAFARRDYLDRRGRPARVEELADHTVIGYDREDRLIQGMRDGGMIVDRHFFAIRTDDEVAAWELVKEGAGIGFGQAHLARRHAEIEQVLVDLPLPELPVWLAAHQDLRTSRRIRRVMDFLAQAFAETDFR